MSSGGDHNRAGDRREQILAHALTLFADHGVQHVSTRQIARAVGVSQPSLYAHFATREAIAIELSDRAFARLRERLIAAVAATGTPAERLIRAGREYIAFGLEEPAAYRVAFMLEGAGPAAGAAKLTSGLAAFEVVRGFFQDIMDDATTAEITAQSCWAAKHGLVALLLSRPEFPWVAREALIEHHLRTICRAALGN